MIVVLLGPPGAGKGTQARLVADKWKLTHLSTGEALRQAIAAGTDRGREVKAIVESGSLVPDETVTSVVGECLSAAGRGRGFLLDGFPRNVRQARIFEQLLAERGLSGPVVVELVVSEDEVVRRLGLRRSCREHGDAGSSPEGCCRKCGAELATRADDAAHVVNERLRVYREQTAPVSEFYGKRGTLLPVDGTGSPEDVAARVDDALTRWRGGGPALG